MMVSDTLVHQSNLTLTVKCPWPLTYLRCNLDRHAVTHTHTHSHTHTHTHSHTLTHTHTHTLTHTHSHTHSHTYTLICN